MRKMLFRFIGCVLAMPVAVYFLPGIVTANWSAALSTGVMLGAVYLVLRPVAKLLLAVFNVLTLGLLGIVLDAWLVQLASALVPGFEVESFWWALAAALIVNLLREAMGKLARR